MIDLTPLDVRQKRGDFRKALRGYDPEEVDGFLALVAERFEELVKENLTLRERTENLSRQVQGQEGRERAVQEALVTAQQLRDEVREQARREAEVLRREVEGEIEDRMRGARDRLADAQRALEALERRRTRFLKAFRGLLEEEMDSLEVEAARNPEVGDPIDLDLGEWRTRVQERVAAARAEEPAVGEESDAAEGEAGPPLPEIEGDGAAEPGAGATADEAADADPDGSPDEPLWLSALLDEPEEERR